MKKIFLTICMGLLFCMQASAQADKPDLMIVPADNWFFKNGFYKEINVQGQVRKAPDYERAFTENNEISVAIAALSELFQQRGFECSSAWESMKALQEENAEEMALDADGDGDAAATSSIDQVMNTVKPDIKLAINWDMGNLGFNKQLMLTVTAYDSFTNKQIGNLQNTTEPMPRGTLIGNMVTTAASGGFEQLTNGMMTHFQSMASKGREIRIRFRVGQNSPITLFDEVGGQRLNQAIQGWMRQHSKGGTGTLQPGSTKNKMDFRGVCIPLHDASGQKMVASEWAQNENLEGFLSSLGVNARVDDHGLGLITVRILGSK
jgi:hypothetical protein